MLDYFQSQDLKKASTQFGEYEGGLGYREIAVTQQECSVLAVLLRWEEGVCNLVRRILGVVVKIGFIFYGTVVVSDSTRYFAIPGHGPCAFYSILYRSTASTNTLLLCFDLFGLIGTFTQCLNPTFEKLWNHGTETRAGQ